MTRIGFRGLFLLVALAVAGLFAWLFARKPPPRIDRVVLLGFDGASPNLIATLLADGRLPAVRRLMREGAWGPLRSFRPAKSGILWTSIATGKTMLKHGIVDWTYLNPAGEQVPIGANRRKARAYWEILSERGIRTGTINWWISYPPTPIKNGYIVSGAFRKRRAPDTVHPQYLFPWLDHLRVRPRDVSEPMKRWGFDAFTRDRATDPEGGGMTILDALPVYFARDLTVDKVGDFLWQQHPVQVFSIYFRMIDVVSHFGEHFIPLPDGPRMSDADPARTDREMARVVAPAYEMMDRTIAKYLDRIDPHTLLIVCSDHGFAKLDGHYHHYHPTLPAPDGVVFLAGAGVRRGCTIRDADLFDIAPTVLHAMGQAVADDMDGAPLLQAFEPSSVRARAVRHIATYEDKPRPTAQDAAGRDEVNAEVMEDLRTLGYIEAAPKADRR